MHGKRSGRRWVWMPVVLVAGCSPADDTPADDTRDCTSRS